VRPILGVRRVFGDLGDHQAWVAELSAAIAELDRQGTRAVIAELA
jgi:hypothetical protein